MATEALVNELYELIKTPIEDGVIAEVKEKNGLLALPMIPFARTKTRSVVCKALHKTYNDDEIAVLIKLYGNPTIGPILLKTKNLLDYVKVLAQES